MPLYEYKCEGCGDVFEVIQRFADEPLRTHDKCGGAVHRLISTSALMFKGSGWYVNDYAKGNSGAKKESSDNAGTKESAPKPAEGKSDTKSDTKSDKSTGGSTSSSTSSTTTSKSE